MYNSGESTACADCVFRSKTTLLGLAFDLDYLCDLCLVTRIFLPTEGQEPERDRHIFTDRETDILYRQRDVHIIQTERRIYYIDRETEILYRQKDRHIIQTDPQAI